ncbi:hypothetical protein JDV02_010644 [Purpureocillium takamizusanense]|uniref:HMG box domain-containing protein n=1 Tax=Purpureocillium takamizusanense TaxID=2060973 RepID=A0A9Q8QR10_9HYPO|nr:uncharacterized protein JDV02_010644 [Purpureocillium takamizusanense]UNI24928.1 hypothetical protein JDV02_010644 [Purpureocillium takamizusanense]
MPPVFRSSVSYKHPTMSQPSQGLLSSLRDGSGRPVRGRSAYHFFADEHRMRVSEERPDMTPGEVGQILGEMWHAQTIAQRAPYERMAAEDKDRYEAEVREWQAELERRNADAR